MEQGDFFAVPLAFSFVFLCVLCVSAVKEVVGEKALQVGGPADRLLVYEEGAPRGAAAERVMGKRFLQTR